MNTSQPPYLARLVLERLAPPNESLVGDLAEAYRGGRSGVWYWRQVVGAMPAAALLGGLWAAGTKSSPARRLRHDDSDAA